MRSRQRRRATGNGQLKTDNESPNKILQNYNMRLPLICSAFFLLFLSATPAAKGQSPVLSPHFSAYKPVLDGHLDETAWQQAAVTDSFIMHFPHDDRVAGSQSRVRVIYTKTHLYIGVFCYSSDEGKYAVQSVKRDFLFEENDAFSVILDPYGDAVSGYAFTTNPYGAQSDGIVDLGGVKGVQNNWDAVWEVEVFRNETENWWSAEFEIPFKSLRFADEKNWLINFARNDLRQNEVSVWSPVPRAIDPNTLAKAGWLQWEKAPQRRGANIAFLPYIAAEVDKNYEEETPRASRLRAGADAKFALTSSLSLDLTYNPDFSQAEVDRQVIDLSRFELRYPEKRPFFLENKDLFANLGNSRVRPFFSRRIGGVGAQPVPVLYGARLSGRVSKNWRIGLMNAQTRGESSVDILPQNYTVGVVQRSVLQGSNLTFFLVNTHAFEAFSPIENAYNRVAGAEFDYRSPDGKWSGKTFYHRSFDGEKLENNAAWDIKMRYKTAKFNTFFGVDAADENYLTDMGFVPRLYHRNPWSDTLARVAYRQFRANGWYRIFPEDKTYKIDYFGFEWSGNLYTQPDLIYQEHNLQLTVAAQWLNQNRLSFAWGNYAPVLFYPFEIDGLDLAVPAGLYRGRGIETEFQTGLRGNFFGRAKIRYGGEYGGRKLSLGGELFYRSPPWGLFAVNVSRESLTDFPDEFGAADFTLIGSKIEVSFNRNFSLTGFLQYNTQLDNFNINTRLHWRLKALSDLFIIYTDNYTAESLNVKNRALVVKFSYRIGI